MDTTTCITNTVWEQYANQQLSAAQQLALQQHVDGCDLCTDIKSGIDFMQNPAMLTTHVAKINTTVDASLGAKLVKLNPWYIAVAATLLAVLGLTLLYKQDVPNAQIAQENKAQHLGVIIDSVKPAEIKLPTPKSLALATTKKANKPSVAVSSTQPILPPEVITIIASDEHQIESDKNLVEVAKSEEKVTLAIDASEKEAVVAMPTRQVQEAKSKSLSSKKPSAPYPSAYHAVTNNNLNNASNQVLEVSTDTSWLNVANQLYARNLADSCLMIIEPKLLNSANAGYEQGLWLAAQCHLIKKDIPTAKLYLTKVVQLNGVLKIKAQTTLNQLK
jgi:hypothetical protein